MQVCETVWFVGGLAGHLIRTSAFDGFQRPKGFVMEIDR